jgi:rSAM/selenodomain-associated transferase 2
MRISVIIPTWNEAGNITRVVRHMKAHGGTAVLEVIVSDGGSTDDTLVLAEAEGAGTTHSPVKGRAGQMNHGVSMAMGDVLYFVHADTLPPANFAEVIEGAMAQGADHGSFRTRFDTSRSMLKLNAFFTRFDRPFFRGGDQSIWVERRSFDRAGGYKEDMLIMEEYDLLARLRALGRFHLSKESTLVSARKYERNSWWRVQLANLTVVRMYRNGEPQERILKSYQRMLDYRRNAF